MFHLVFKKNVLDDSAVSSEYVYECVNFTGISNMFKKTYLSFLISVLLPASAMAVSVDVPASGKTEDIAIKKANINAVRMAMIEIKGEKFLQEHTKEIRNLVILKIDDYVSGTQVISSQKNEKGNLDIYARVEVDKDKLAAVLNGVGGGANTQTSAETDVATQSGTETASNQGGEQQNTSQGTGEIQPEQDKPVSTAAASTAREKLVTDEELAYLSGVNPAEINTLDGTKQYYHALRNKMLAATQENLTGFGSTLTLKSYNDENISDTIDVFKYSAIEEDDEEFYTVTMTNSYEVGKVNSSFSINDGFFENFGLDESVTPLVKEFLNTSKHSVNIASDTAESVFTLKEGELGGFKWKPVQFDYKLSNVSKTLSDFEINFKIPELANPSANMLLSDTFALVEKRPHNFVFNFNVKDFKFASENRTLEIGNYYHKIGSVPSADMKPANYDLGFMIGIDRYSDIESGKAFGINGTQFKFNIKNIDLSHAAAKCGMEPAGFGFTEFFKCINSDSDNENYDPLSDNPVMATFRQSADLGYELSLQSEYINLARIMETEVFDLKGVKFATETSKEKFGLNTHLDKFEVVDRRDKMNIEGLNIDYGFVSNASGRKDNLDMSFKASIDKFYLFHRAEFDITGNSIELGFKNLNTVGLSKFCNVGENDHLSIIPSMMCIAGNESGALIKPSISAIQKDTNAFLNINTTLNGAPVSFNSVLTVNPDFDGSDMNKAMAGITVTADLKLDKSIFSKEQYDLAEVPEKIKDYILDPEAQVYEFHMVFKNGTFTVNDREVK